MRMDREPRFWRTAVAIYLLLILSLQAIIYIAVPKAGHYSCRGWVRTGPAGDAHSYISTHYLKRSPEGFLLATETGFLDSINSTSPNSIDICIADILWCEQISLFNRLSLFSISDRKRTFKSFSAREGSGGDYTPINPNENAEILNFIGYRTTSPGFIQLGTSTIAFPKVDLLSLALKLLIHSMLIWYSIRFAPSANKTIRWWMLPTPRKIRGKCANCQYSTKGLTTPICPECGQHHGMAWNSNA